MKKKPASGAVKARKKNVAAEPAKEELKIPGGDEITQSTAFRRAAVDAKN